MRSARRLADFVGPIPPEWQAPRKNEPPVGRVGASAAGLEKLKEAGRSPVKISGTTMREKKAAPRGNLKSGRKPCCAPTRIKTHKIRISQGVAARGTQREERFHNAHTACVMARSSLCAGRPLRRSEAERKSRPAPFEMTVGGGRQLCAQPRVGEAHLMGEAEDNEDREGLRDLRSSERAPGFRRPSFILSRHPGPFGPANPTRRVVACKL